MTTFGMLSRDMINSDEDAVIDRLNSACALFGGKSTISLLRGIPLTAGDAKIRRIGDHEKL
jgi:hypothetical protein